MAQTIFWKFLKICEKIYLNIFMNIKNSWPIVIKSFTFSKRETTCRLSKQKQSTGVIVVCKKSVRSNFTKLTGKRLCQSLFFNKETLAQVFPVNFVKFLKIPFLYNTSGGCFFLEPCQYLRGSSWQRKLTGTNRGFLNRVFFIFAKGSNQKTKCWFKRRMSSSIKQISKFVLCLF